MKLLLETSLKNLFISLVDNEGKTISYFNEEIQKKSDVFDEKVKEVLGDVSINDIDAIYVTNGPGSFMGARVAFTYARTLAQLKDIDLFVGSSFAYVSGGNDGTYYIDARGGSFYVGDVKSSKIVEKVEKIDTFESKVDYQAIIDNPSNIMGMFNKVDDLVNAKVNYIKDPQIGGK